MSDDPPPSAWQLAQRLGDDLLDPGDLAAEAEDLVASIRALADAAVATDLPPDDRRRLREELDRVTAELAAAARQPVVLLGRHADGRIENLTQAGSGRLNPHAPPLRFDPIVLPDPDALPTSVEIVGRCTLTESHGGPPERAHGGVVATLLDETLGLAATVAGASGLTAGINVSYRAGTPLHTPLTVHARYTHSEGRKQYAEGEVRAADAVTATAVGVYIAPGPPAPASH